MNNKNTFFLSFLAICLLIWGIGGPILIRLPLFPPRLLNQDIASLITILIWTIGFALLASFVWSLINKSRNKEDKAVIPDPIINVVKFEINKSFSDWVKFFDNEIKDQESAGLTLILRLQSNQKTTEVMAVFKSLPGDLERYLLENQQKLVSGGFVLGSEKISTYFLDEELLSSGLNTNQ